MLILDATTKSLEVKLAGAVSANELPVTAHYTDITTTLYTPGSNDTQTNGSTAATIVAAPAASTQRHVESISVYNADTAAATVTIQLNNNSTLRIITKVTLQAAEQLFYEDGMGWQIIDANGAVIRGTNVSDTAYASSWDGVTTIAPSKNAVYDQMLLQMLKNGSNLAIGSDADGDMYYRASSVLARLAKGTYGTILCMNSAATAPEWGGVYGYGIVTKDISTISGAVDQAVTISPAFKPSRGIIFTFIETTTCFSVGAVQGTGTNYAYNHRYDGLGIYAAVPCYLEISAGNIVKFTVKSMDTSGLTITWEKHDGTLAGTAYVMCFMFRG